MTLRSVRVAGGVAVATAIALSLTGGPSAGADAPLTTRPTDLGPADESARAELASHHAPGTGPDGQLVARNAVADSDGSVHVHYDRSYRGLPVIGGDQVAHLRPDGSLRSVSGTTRRDVSLSVTPDLSKAAARQAVAGLLPAGLGLTSAPPTLAVDATGSTPRLVWQATASGTAADGTPSLRVFTIDANTGTLLGSEERIETVDGSGASLYSGTVTVATTKSGSTFQLKDPTRANHYVNDANNRSDGLLCSLGLGCATGTLMTDSDNIWGTGAVASRQSAAVDAAYGAGATWDYYKSVFGRNGIWGTGKAAWSRVHYGNKYNNAFWDGTKMTYGDGDGTNFGPLVSLDVAGHEMSHGVTGATANLSYSGESGGLNEATSDIFGTMVEFSANNPADPGDYLIGERFDLKNRVGIRRMDNPASDGSSVNCWSSSVGNLDVHYSSGVGNHFFYLLAEGSGTKVIGGVTHDSPTCNGATVTGIGRDAAQRIWYRALTVYMTSSTNYAGARSATLSAATDLFGAGSAQQNAVAAAWSAVSVN